MTTLELVRQGRHARSRRRRGTTLAIAAVVAVLVGVTLVVGNTVYPLDQVLAVLAGQDVPGASFTVGQLRLPRAMLGLLAGFAFGAAGATFQTLLRNPLASPDILGISSGASVAAVATIILLRGSDTAVSVAALAGALATAGAIYLLAHRGRFAGARLILIGIGVAAMLDSLISYLLLRASLWDVQTAARWLTGSLNGATWDVVLPLAIATAVLVPLLLTQSRGFRALQLGDDSAASLGVRTDRTRLLMLVAAVGLLAVATAACGPIAFVAFMAGPIAARLVGPGGSLLVPAGLIGAALVLAADLVGQFALPVRYPVGIVTGVLGAPYLVYLLVRSNRAGEGL